MNYAGVDGGKHGAVVLLDDCGRVLASHPTPLSSGVHDIQKAKAIIASFQRPFIVTCEKPIRVDRGNGSDSGFIAVKASVAFWRAAFGRSVPFTEVHPRTWIAALLSGVQGTGKQRSINFCRVFMPDLQLIPDNCHVPNDGISDAACIAEYGRRIGKASARGYG